MKKELLALVAIIVTITFAGCGEPTVEKVNIPKFDPNKKTETPVETQTSTNLDELTEPAFPKATPATEWTMFRRTPDNLGVVDADIKLPLKKGKTEYRFMSFGAPTSNVIYGSPAVIKNKLFFGCQLGYLSCYKFDSAEPVWKNAEQFDEGKGPVTSTLAVNDSMVFFGTGQGILYAYDLYGDIKMWSFKTGKNISAPPNTDPHNVINNGLIIGGPKVVDGRIYFGSFDGKMYCLDAKKGKEIWNFPTKSKVYASPAIVDDRLYFTNFKGQIFCLDINTGKEIWNSSLPKGTLSSPVVFGSRLWVGCKDSKLYCLNNKNGKILWSYQAPDNDFGIESCPIIDEKSVYGTTAAGVTFALDRKTGKKIWQSQTSKASLLADPLIVRDNMICGDKDGVLYIVDKKTGKTLDSYYTNTVSTVGADNRCIGSSPIIIGNEIIFSSYDSNVYIVRGQ